MTILVCDDDKEIVDAIEIYLQQEGYSVEKVYDGEQALEVLKTKPVDLMIIDVMMPKLDGIRATLQVRQSSSIPIIILSAKTEDADKILGLNVGADDYMTKPFSLMVLISKVNALMHRLHDGDGMRYISGDIEVRIKDMQVTKNNEPVTLSKTEMQLLLYLMKNAGKIASKENILDQVWGLDGQFVDDNTVAVNISRLKNKLGTDQISNVRGLGYIWTGQVKQL